MYYAIYCEDTPDSFEKRRAIRPAHLQRLEKLNKQNRLLLAGPLLKEDHSDLAIAGVQGSLIIAEFENIDDAKAWAAADPYATGKVYARIVVTPFKKILPLEANE